MVEAIFHNLGTSFGSKRDLLSSSRPGPLLPSPRCGGAKIRSAGTFPAGVYNGVDIQAIAMAGAGQSSFK
jgi:hypothetical protein